jgi:hypothetical protein
VLWFSPTTAGGAGNAQTPGSGNFNPLYWTAMSDMTLTYNGEIFNRFDAGSYALWNMVEDQKSSTVANYTLFTNGAAGVTQATNVYVKCDFSQVSVPSERESVLVHGKPKGWACAAAAA